MTIAEFDKLHDMLKVIHEENQMIMKRQIPHIANGQIGIEEYYDMAFKQAEQGRLKKWKTDGCKLD